MTRPCPGPIRDTRPPRFAAPAGACDCHAHVFGPPAKFPYVAERSFTPPDALVADYLAMLDTVGFERGVIVHGSVHGTDNEVSRRAIAHEPDRLRGVAVVDASFSPDQIAALDAGGFRGTRMSTTVKGGPGFGNLEAIARLVAPHRWHLVVHTMQSAELVDLAPRLLSTGLDIVVDHIGRVLPAEGVGSPGFRQLLALLETGRCWVKISGQSRVSAEGYPWADTLPLVRGVIACRPDRVLWGSDWPHPNYYTEMPNDGDLVDAFAEWVPDPDLQRAILVDNPAALYGFATDE